MFRIGGRLRGGTPFWAQKLPCWPAGGQVEAKNGLKIGQNRPFSGVQPKYPQNTPKSACFAFGAHLCWYQGAVRIAAGHLWKQKQAVHHFRGVLTPRIAVYSASRMQGKQGKRPRRVGPPAGLAPQGSSCFHCHRPRSARINLVNYQL